MMSTASVAPLHLKLPATSANLGPGFDALGLALSLYLTIDAVPAPAFAIEATGRAAALCANPDTSLILTTYRDLLGAAAPPLALTLHNEIPLGMGCGSSAAAILAGVLLANNFGQLNWPLEQLLYEACRREGHPDNVAACFHGGMTASAMTDGEVVTATCGLDLPWKLILALPAPITASGEKTEKARALLPPSYTRADTVTNVQSTALLVSAFALNRPELLRHAMRDRLHQPFRMATNPLLAKLLTLAGTHGVHGVALSGAGPSVLLISDEYADQEALTRTIQKFAEDDTLELLTITISNGYFSALL